MFYNMPIASRTRSSAKNGEMWIKTRSRERDGDLEVKKQSNVKNEVGLVSDTQPNSVFAPGKPHRANVEKEGYNMAREDENMKLCLGGDSDDDDLYIVEPLEISTQYVDVIDLCSSSEVDDDNLDEDDLERSDAYAAVDDEDEAFSDHGNSEDEILEDPSSPEEIISEDVSGEDVEFVGESEAKTTGLKTKTIEPGLKRIKAHGLDILIQERDSREDVTASICVLEDPNSPGEIISEDVSGEDVEFVGESEAKTTGLKTKTIEPGLKRIKAHGLDILIQERDSREDVTASICAGNSVAQRTRSHSKRKTKKVKLGTLSQPICVDQEDEDEVEDEKEPKPEFDSDYGDLGNASNYIVGKRKRGICNEALSADEEDEETCDSDPELRDLKEERNRVLLKRNSTRNELTSYDAIDDENHNKFCNGDGVSYGSDGAKSSGDEMDGIPRTQNVGKRWKLRKSSIRKHIPPQKDYDVIKILQDSIRDKGDVPLEKLVSSTNHETHTADITLPLKFHFRTEETPPEKSEEEKELEQLWAEYDRVLNMTTQNPAPVAAEQVENDMDAVDTASLCLQGKHRLIIDDEIGIICAVCSHVHAEIKHVLPSFSRYPFGKSGRRDYCVEHVDHTLFDDLGHQSTGWDNLSGHDHNCSGTVWDIIPEVKNRMYPHQCEAFEFLWKKIAGEIALDKLEKEVDFPHGGGCIISHAPGTGKTFLTIAFLWSFLEVYPNGRPIIIAPKSMLLTWEEEFRKWKEEFGKWKFDIPFHNLNNDEYSYRESDVAMTLLRKSGFNNNTKETIRLVKLFSWKRERSILGIGYSLFMTLAGRSKDLREALLELPGLLVLDEGHTPRNDKSRIWKTVSEIRTRKRIILSGTPFQNNFDELYNTLCLASPMFGGGKKNETKGKWAYLINAIGKASDKNGDKGKLLSEVKRMIRPFVHVYKGTILQDILPGLTELVIVLKPTILQKNLLEDIQELKNKLKYDHLESLISIHPSLYPSEDGNKVERCRIKTEDGVKTKFLMELIRLSAIMDEKVLVFSQFIPPLNFLTDQIKSRFNWREGKEVLVIRGKDDMKQRQASISTFNDPGGKVRVLLASKKACFEGINLVGASRVVLLDVEWNPAVERQAVSRAYRVGQKKMVYTYRLISAGTREEEKCSRQAEKDYLSEFMFFKSSGDGCEKDISPANFEDEILKQMLHHENFRHMFERIATNKR